MHASQSGVWPVLWVVVDPGKGELNLCLVSYVIVACDKTAYGAYCRLPWERAQLLIVLAAAQV